METFSYIVSGLLRMIWGVGMVAIIAWLIMRAAVWLGNRHNDENKE